MSTFGDDLIQSLGEALAHAKGEGPAIVHAPMAPREVRKQAKLTQAQMAPLMGMSLSGYRKWEQGTRRVSGPAATLLRIIEKEPEAVRRALLPPCGHRPDSGSAERRGRRKESRRDAAIGLSLACISHHSTVEAHEKRP